MNKNILLVLFVAGLALVEPHGFLKSPLSRTSIFTNPRYGASMPFWWDHTGVWCGNVHQDFSYSTCGRCGDAEGNTLANQGGIYDKGIITATYRAGQVSAYFNFHYSGWYSVIITNYEQRITIEAQIDAAHAGFFMIELCPQETETDSCFQKLPILSGSMPLRNGNICVDFEAQTISADVKLPRGVKCERCTLRWTYRTSYGAIQGDPSMFMEIYKCLHL